MFWPGNLFRLFVLLAALILQRAYGYKIVVLSLPWPGDSSPLRVFAHTLAEQGHSVIFSMPTEYEEVAPKHPNIRFLSSGRSAFTPEQLGERIARLAKVDCLEAKKIILPTLKTLSRGFIDIIPALKEEKVDLIIHPLCVFVGFEVAEKVGAPSVLFQSKSLFEPITTHLYGHRLEPAYVPSTGIAIKSLVMSFFERVQNTFVTFTIRSHSEYEQLTWRNHLRDHLDLPRIDSGSLPPPALVICASSWGLITAHPVSPFIHLVGPMFPPIEVPAIEEEVIKWLNASDEQVIVLSHERIYSFEEELIQKLVNAVGHIPRRIMWIAPEQIQVELERIVLPANVRVWPSFPTFSVLGHPKVEALISAGALNSYMEALWHGKPALCMAAYSEQHEDCISLERSGAGLSLDKIGFTQQEVLLKVMQLLEDPKFKEKATQYSRVFRADGGPKRAVELIENLLFVGRTDRLIPLGMSMPWWQRDLLDVFFFVCFIKISFVIVLIKVVWFCCSRCSCNGDTNKANPQRSPSSGNGCDSTSMLQENREQ